ncbi:MAG: hypothetical protein LBR76_08315 [Oscillospiraceae bacterium]|jgi:ABC-2 type transport system permease protein|nr:hypothetical protein [Oscillospiraceae bacterium]
MKRTLRACLSLFRIRAAESLQYRLAALSGAVVSIVWTLIEVTVYIVFYTYAEGRANFSLTLGQVIAYSWVKELLYALLVFNIDDEIRGKIISGDVGVELCRPLDLYWHWFAKSSAGRVGTLTFRSGAVLLAGILIPGQYGMTLPASLPGFLLFLLSVGCAFLLCSAFGALVSAVRLGITWGDGPTYMLILLGHVLSGGYLPLQLWPDFIQTALLYQPFAGMIDIPARLYVGSAAPAEAVPFLLVQIGWSAVFVAVGRLVMSRRLKNVIVQGG